VHPTDPTVIWSTDFSRVVRFRSSGVTVEPTAPLPSFSPFLNQIRAVALDATNPNIVYVGQTSREGRTPADETCSGRACAIRSGAESLGRSRPELPLK
jgi:hypothetical protein